MAFWFKVLGIFGNGLFHSRVGRRDSDSGFRLRGLFAKPHSR